MEAVIPEPICGFRGEYNFLSNFYLVDIEIDGVSYKSSEHYYMAEKTTSDVWRKKIMDAPTGAIAKRFGKQVPLRSEWHEKYKNQSMMRALTVKFQNPYLRKRLLDTGTAYIEETNHWGDVYWGVCNGEGKNMLGRMLMFIRKEIRDNTI